MLPARYRPDREHAGSSGAPPRFPEELGFPPGTTIKALTELAPLLRG
jgi:hypothetical protein